jgi:hypothetical protein
MTEEEHQRFLEKLDRRRHIKEALKFLFWLFLIVGAGYVINFWDEFIENPLIVLIQAFGATVILAIIYTILDSMD